MTCHLESRDRCRHVGSDITHCVEHTVIRIVNEQTPIIVFNREPTEPKTLGEHRHVVVEFYEHDATTLGECCHRTSVLKFSCIDCEQRIAHTFDLAEQV